LNFVNESRQNSKHAVTILTI